MATSRERQPAGQDKELQAIGAMISLLQPLDEEERGRVLEYVLKRLDMATVRPAAVVSEKLPTAVPSTPQAITDIRTLTAEKQPRSANEMAALVAYYVSELAPRSRPVGHGESRTYQEIFQDGRLPATKRPKECAAERSSSRLHGKRWTR